MFQIQNYPSFLAAIFIFQLVPGPGTLAILNATARNGLRAGFAAVLGTLAGDFTYMLASVIGLAAIMNSNPLLFQGLQWFGAVYLCWMGIQIFRASRADDPTVPDPPKNDLVFFRQALAVSLTNPKVVLFFVAFFPLFLRADAPRSTLGIMMAHVTTLSFLYQAGLVLIGNAAARRLSAWPSARRLATRLAGMALIGFGIKLALNNR